MINLYAESDFSFFLSDGINIKLKQITDYPEDGRIRIQVTPDIDRYFALSLRIPAWCNDVSLKINGKKCENYLKSNGFIKIKRKWSKADEIVLKLDMCIRQIKGFCQQSGKTALLYGPILFCFNPKNNPNIPVADLLKWTVSPDTASLINVDDVGFGSLACRLKAYKNGKSKDILLTSFPDPEGEAVYLNTLDSGNAVYDELIHLKETNLCRKFERGKKSDWNGQ